MSEPEFDASVRDRVLDLSGRYILHAQLEMDEQGRVRIDCPSQSPLPPPAIPASDCASVR